LGVSVEGPRYLDRLDRLREIGAGVRFVSFEPLLGPVEPDLTGIDWVIVGGESGTDRRPFNVEWARVLRDRCAAAGVAFFYKQGSGRWPGMDDVLDGQTYKAWPAR
jgi:protein gp37